MVKQPHINPIVARVIEEVPKVDLNNGIPLYFFDGAPQEIIKVDLLFEAGRWHEPKNLLAKSCARLLKTGTSTKKANEIQESIDFLGASIKATSGYHYTTISAYCLTSKLASCLTILHDILCDAVFPKSELDIYKAKESAKLAVEWQKHDFIADQHFKSTIFGDQHPYGYFSKAEDLDQISTTHLQSFFSDHFNPQNCTIIACGNVSPESIQIIDDIMGQEDWKKGAKKMTKAILDLQHTVKPGKTSIPMNDSVQNAVTIGNILFKRKSEDYNSFALLNTIFGGFFGSRLMKNIREDKGFTYGIYSGVQNYKNGDCLWSIQTDTGNDYLASCLDEIYREMDIIQSQLITDEEINVAKNYFMGRLLQRTDGPFNLSSSLKSYLTLGLDISYFNNMITDIENVGSETLINLARKYFNKENFVEVIVGNV